MEGGKNMRKSSDPKTSDERVMIGKRSMIVYVGSRGCKYIKKGGKFVTLASCLEKKNKKA